MSSLAPPPDSAPLPFQIFPRAGRRLALQLALLALLLPGTACVSVRPFEAVRQEVEKDPHSLLLELNGHAIHAIVQEPAASEGGGRPAAVVLLHGFGGSAYSWNQVQPRLAERYRTVALDLNGFGYSERPRKLAAYTRSGQVRMILDALDALGIERAHFIGHSYGGALTLTLAALHPERVDSMVLLDSAAPSYAEQRRRWIAAFPPVVWSFVRGVALREPFVRRALERAFYDDSQVTDKLVEQYLSRLRVEGASRAYRGLTAPQLLHEDRREVRFEDIDVPALVVWGQDDPLIKVEDGRKAAMKLPQVEFVVIEDCGHSPMEERPQAFLDFALPFLERQSAG